MEKQSRQLNLDLLRIIAMLFIITGHLLGDNGGNLLGRQEQYSLSWFVLWALEGFAVAGTNCFVLISGYFLIQHHFTWKKVLILCVEIWFYSVMIYCSCLALGIVEFEKSALLQVLTPILGRTWWFISTYLGMYILSPFMNKLLLSIDKATHKKLIIICVVLFSAISTFYPFTDTFVYGGGGGLIWFFTLYIIAAYIRLYDDSITFVPKRYRRIYLCTVGLIIISKYTIAFFTELIIGKSVGTSLFFSNSSILNLFASVSLFLLFVKLNTEAFPKIVKNAIVRAGVVPFGVYIIHNNPWISSFLWNKIITWFYSENILLQLLLIVIVPITLYCVCGLIELGRKIVFSLIKLS